MKRFAVVVAGCGHRDGAEITETVSALIALSETGSDYQVFAPDLIVPPTDHITGKKSGESRNLITEAARIARGNVKDLKDLRAKDFDGLVFPGGFGAALNLSDWAHKGAASKVIPDVERVITEFHSAGKPIGAICIAPHLVAKVLGSKGVAVTIGNDAETASEISKTGADHIECSVNDFVTDREHKIVTTPAYMYGDAKPFEVYKGIRGAIRELVEMA